MLDALPMLFQVIPPFVEFGHGVGLQVGEDLSEQLVKQFATLWRAGLMIGSFKRYDEFFNKRCIFPPAKERL